MRFWRDRRGNVAIMFALAVVPVVGAMGAALDYSRANSYRTDMQKALDATALAVSKVMPMEQTELDEVAMQYFSANLGNHLLTNLKLTVEPEQGQAKLRATGDYEPAVASLFGIDKFEIGVSAEARWGIGKVEVALVLDNSGSMNDYSRMTHLQDAAHELLDVLKKSARDPDDAKVAIVPFDQRVNVGIANKDADWLRWDLWDPYNGRCEKSGYNSESSCTRQKICTKSQYTTKRNCENNRGTWRDAIWTPDRSEWKGCVEDRNKDNDVSDAAPAGTATYYPAAQCEHGLHYPGRVLSMQRLTSDWTALGSKVDDMQPAGYTNIAIGLAWGWHLVSPADVATEGRPYGTEDLTKYIILMTDGDNTRNRFGDSTNTMNKRVETVCANIKKENIQIYTIRLINGNASLLRDCATATSMYYDVQDAASLASVFKNIASQIASLHLAK